MLSSFYMSVPSAGGIARMAVAVTVANVSLGSTLAAVLLNDRSQLREQSYTQEKTPKIRRNEHMLSNSTAHTHSAMLPAQLGNRARSRSAARI